MLENEYQQRDEYVRVRRLGEFGPVDTSSVTGPVAPDAAEQAGTGKDTRKPRKAVRLSRSGFALMLMVLGIVVLAVGITMTFGLGWGLTTLGAMTFVVGFFTALPDKPEPTAPTV